MNKIRQDKEKAKPTEWDEAIAFTQKKLERGRKASRPTQGSDKDLHMESGQGLPLAYVSNTELEHHPHLTGHRPIYRKDWRVAILPTISGDWSCSRKRIVESRKNWLDAFPF